jgi:hypothetical protein
MHKFRLMRGRGREPCGSSTPSNPPTPALGREACLSRVCAVLRCVRCLEPHVALPPDIVRQASFRLSNRSSGDMPPTQRSVLRIQALVVVRICDR